MENIIKINPRDYQTLFRLDVFKGRVTGMLSDFIMSGSLRKGNPIITFDGRWWTFRLEKKTEILLAKKGLRIFGSKKLYEKYARDFRDYMVFSKKNILKSNQKILSDMSRKDFFDLIKNLQKFWYFYGMTEMVYHDLAHEKMLEKEDSVLKFNLSDLEKLKFQGRNILNAYILEDGVLDRVLKFISNKYLNGDKVIKYFYIDELKDLLSDKKISQKIIRRRAKSFVVFQKNGKICHLEGKNAKKITDGFKKYEEVEFKKQSLGLKGRIANKGKIVGRVVISPMLDIKAALEVEKRMKKGNILIVQSTNPDLMVLCKKAGAIVTDQGGMLSHAAVISRELGIPCIVNTVNATKVFKDGDLVEVDAFLGLVKIIK